MAEKWISSEEVEFTQLIIAGKEHDPADWGIKAIKPPTADAHYWEILNEDGGSMLTTEIITIQLEPKEKKAAESGQGKGGRIVRFKNKAKS